MNKWSIRKRIIGIFVLLFIVLLIIPLSWISSTGICFNWVTFTEEWYKILLSSFVSSVLFGVVAFLFIDSWKRKIKVREINTLIIKQKEIAGQILSNCNARENILNFLYNHDKIIPHCPQYLEGTVKGQKYFIIRQMNFFINNQTDCVYKEKAKNDIIEFCKSFI